MFEARQLRLRGSISGRETAACFRNRVKKSCLKLAAEADRLYFRIGNSCLLCQDFRREFGDEEARDEVSSLPIALVRFKFLLFELFDGASGQ